VIFHSPSNASLIYCTYILRFEWLPRVRQTSMSLSSSYVRSELKSTCDDVEITYHTGVKNLSLPDSFYM
jgi:hypothetical protein